MFPQILLSLAGTAAFKPICCFLIKDFVSYFTPFPVMWNWSGRQRMLTLMGFPLSLLPLGMSVKGPCRSPHALQLCREWVPRPHSNQQPSSCCGHCPFCWLFLINFISLFHWSHLSFCLYFLFSSYILSVSTQGYETFCFLTIASL